VILLIFVFSFSACQKANTEEEIIQVGEILPEGAVTEITYGHPDFRIAFVGEDDANVSVKFKDRSLRIDGVEDQNQREKLAGFILQYLENPNKKAEDKANRDSYNKLPPKEKMTTFVERMRKNYPAFDYEWISLDEGNVKLEYGDNSLLITGVENEGAREEIAHGVMQIQKEIDAFGEEGREGQGEHAGERERGEHEGEGGEHSEGGEGEGEEAGPRIEIGGTHDEVRKGSRLILTFDKESSSFIGTVENLTERTLTRVRIEVHLSNGAELGPTEPISLAPGKKADVKLTAEGQEFEWWKAHAEVGQSNFD